ncbi:cytidylate kinase [Mariprofundus ferrinatatus]|uniref:Cytidylate kinase n=1 Tax=Mariprofundus ferrinatatus TaxID=1921087 RepID=A0A2K8L2A0_9PROT|nr:(d)CMP kinase [Mariprofundus ferrinatatus]ATX81445.1 cytidylate kinase [Mariprofundus ferrinatatus]
MSRWKPVDGLQVAIDGPSGSGKGTAAKMLAKEIGLPVLDTGLLYRLIGGLAIERAIALDESESLVALANEMLESVAWTVDGITFDGENWTDRLRSEAVGNAASKVASQPEVRECLLGLQRKIAESGCVMDGRDIGTVVLPGAQAKFFLTASVRERARRRWIQLKEQGGSSLEAVVEELKMRDQRDQERQHAPLLQAEDAIAIDSTTMRVDDVVDRMTGVLERRGLIVVS